MNATPPELEPAASISDRELLNSRIFDVTPECLFSAWTDPARLAQWWGPRGFTNTFEECDPRPGGVWQFVMHGPDGGNYKNESRFLEVVRPHRIVIHHICAPRFHLTATFEDLGGKTKLIWHMLFERAQDCAAVKKFAVDANEQNFDRLAANVANQPMPA